MKCRLCHAVLEETFVDLGVQPLANAYVAPEAVDSPETFYPLHARACGQCSLVQLPELASPRAIFSDYAFVSSTSKTWVDHCRAYAGDARSRYCRDGDLVVEVASNDGCLLKAFQALGGVTVLGVEPAANVSEAARRAGVPTVTGFFGEGLARDLVARGRRADLVVANNVLAHVPGLHDFVAGLALLLAPTGVLTLEFPHLLHLVRETRFDTVYHEHFSYFSLSTARAALSAHGLRVFDVEEVPTHGGSLRVHAETERAPESARTPSPRVARVLSEEEAFGLRAGAGGAYAGFAPRVREVKRALLTSLIRAKRRGDRVVGYGAAAKASTLLNYAGVGTDFLDYVVDKNPRKQGRFIPGVRVPIEPVERLAETRPSTIVLLAWNMRKEIEEQLAFTRAWGCRVVSATGWSDDRVRGYG